MDDFFTGYFGGLSGCEVRRFSSSRPLECTLDRRVLRDVADARKKLGRQLEKCIPDRLAALCPLAQRKPADLVARVTSGPDSIADRLSRINQGLFVDEQAPACGRPSDRVSSKARDCARVLAKESLRVVAELLECHANCEIRAMKQDRPDPCVDVRNGVPISRKLSDCIDRAYGDLLEEIDRRCTDAALVELGCPLGEGRPQEVFSRLLEDTSGLMSATNLSMFHSGCRSDTGSAVQATPMAVLLLPSGTPRQVFCGDVLDDEFFGGDSVMQMLSPLNCDAFRSVADGLTIEASDVTLDGQGLYGIQGPDHSRFRMGAGIRLAPGAQGVTLTGLKWIRRFGVGIADAGDNDGLVVADMSLRRNERAGLMLTSSDVTIRKVYADRNGIAFHLQGDDVLVVDSTARRSEGGDGQGPGVQLASEDRDGDGTAIVFRDGLVELNGVGILVEGEGHRIEGNVVRRNRGDGIVVAGSGVTLAGNLATDSRRANGIRVTGSRNSLLENRLEKNEMAGLLVEGGENLLLGNTAGNAKRGNGNRGTGFVVPGAGNRLGDNGAYRNRRGAYDIGGGNIDLGGNVADGQPFGFQAGTLP